MGWFETLIPAAASLAGGALSNLVNQNQQENEATRNQSNFDIQQDNFVRNAQIRSQDAKAAGLHPLYALGGNAQGPSGSQPIVMQDSIGGSLNQAGQNLASAYARSETRDQKVAELLQLDLLRSQIRETDARAGLVESQKQQMLQSGQNGIGLSRQPVNTPLGQLPNPPGQVFGPMPDVIEGKGSPVISGMSQAPGFVAGTNDYYQQWRLRDGFYLPLPRSEDEGPEETIQNMSLGAWNGMLEQGQRMYGGNWAQEMTDWRYRGIPPKGYYLSVEQQGPRRKDTHIPSNEKGYKRKELDRMFGDIKKGLKKFTDEGGKYEQDWLQKLYQDWSK